jgi:uncharacterized protein
MRAQMTREMVYITGPRGRLAGELCYPETATKAVVLIANPHPLMGGAVNNNVVERLALDLPAHGYVTLRFDYGGVGRSGGEPVDVAENMKRFWETGTTEADPRMAEETERVASWLGVQFNQPIVGVGYSFGAYTLSTSVIDRLAALAVISPTLARHDFDPVKQSDVPVMAIYSDDDFATPADLTRDWLESLGPRACGHLIAGGEHFYRGLETRVVELCANFFEQSLAGGRRS